MAAEYEVHVANDRVGGPHIKALVFTEPHTLQEIFGALAFEGAPMDPRRLKFSGEPYNDDADFSVSWEWYPAVKPNRKTDGQRSRYPIPPGEPLTENQIQGLLNYARRRR